MITNVISYLIKWCDPLLYYLSSSSSELFHQIRQIILTLNNVCLYKPTRTTNQIMISKYSFERIHYPYFAIPWYNLITFSFSSLKKLSKSAKKNNVAKKRYRHLCGFFFSWCSNFSSVQKTSHQKHIDFGTCISSDCIM